MQKNQSLVAARPQNDDHWKGYTLEDLRYRRAYVAARRELEKERLYNRLGATKKGATESVTNRVRRVASMVPFMEYGIMAFSVGSKVFRFLGKFRKKKK
nr:hypothetical protein [Bacteroides sp.]